MTDAETQPGPRHVKHVLCLANSRKMSGRCIAGREIAPTFGEWVRPVSNRPDGEVSEEERQFEDGSDPKVLDCLRIPLEAPAPHGYQQENWRIDPQFYWARFGQADWALLQNFVDSPEHLWGDGHSSTVGLNDRIPVEDADNLRSSLRLIRVDSLTIEVGRFGAAFGDRRRKVRGSFRYAGVAYNLGITDPVYERRYKAMLDGTHTIGECCLTISLGEPYKGNVYKLIAAIIERAHTERR